MSPARTRSVLPRLIPVSIRQALLPLLVAFGVVFPARAADRVGHPWVVYYADSAPLTVFAPYRLLVFDSDAHPPLQGLQEAGKTVLGYLSLAEVAANRDWYDAVKGEGLLLAENPNWAGSRYVDLRDRRWTERVIEDLVPRILQRGFDGLFLDTLDDAAHLERTDPKRFKGMTEAAVRLVRAIRRHYPGIVIMQNRGYELLPAVGDALDAVLGESIYADYDFETKTYRRVPEALYRQQRDILRAARRAHPALGIYTLDYWDPDDSAGIAAIYAEERRNGFHPYVATVELDRVVAEPAK